MLDSRYQLGRCLKGVLLLARGDYSGLAFLRDGLAWLREARVRFNYVQLLGAFAKGLGEAGQIAGARAAIDDAVEQAESREEFWCLPELLRIKGEIMLLERLAGAGTLAEAHFQRALAMARQQEALSWELRIAMSQAGLWRQSGRAAEGIELVCAAYSRFTEGFGTADLKRARAVIGDRTQ